MAWARLAGRGPDQGQPASSLYVSETFAVGTVPLEHGDSQSSPVLFVGWAAFFRALSAIMVTMLIALETLSAFVSVTTKTGAPGWLSR